jgi:hypothetical protein
MPQVFNKRASNIPTSAVYVGRPTKWGNQFSHQEGTLARYKVASRDEAVSRYEEWLLDSKAGNEVLAAAKKELRGKDLVCWCAPLRCHADVLLFWANRDPLVMRGSYCAMCDDEFPPENESEEQHWLRDEATGEQLHICNTCWDERPE